jgi:hypothetical protein
MALVHRLAAFIWLEFDLASDLMVLHRCDNRRCFNPEHLFTGTHQDNMDDMWSKGRNQDQRHPRKLTRNAVITMRRRYAAGGITTRALAKEFGIGKSTVSAIIRMEIWADVGS